MTTKTINQLERGDVIATEKGQLEAQSVQRPSDHTAPAICCTDKKGRTFVIPYRYGNQAVAVVGNSTQQPLF